MDFLAVKSEELGVGSSIHTQEFPSEEKLYFKMAIDMYSIIKKNNDRNHNTTLIVPLGPVGQYFYLFNMINTTGLSLKNTTFINMDEYLDEKGEWLPYEHPLSFRRQMDEHFYNRIDVALNVPPENRVFPNPSHPQDIDNLIKKLGCVDACFGGIGVNGHVAFNEPPTPDISADEYAVVSTRKVLLTPETLTVNAVMSYGGYYPAMPKTAITVGMRQILCAKKIRLYAMRDWHRGSLRAILHGQVTAQIPASLLQRHSDVKICYTPNVGQKPGAL